MTKKNKRSYGGPEWQRLYVEQRGLMARGGIQAAILLNAGAAVALLAFLGTVLNAPADRILTVDFAFLKWAFICFGAGMFFATSTYYLAYLTAVIFTENRHSPFGSRLRWVGVAIVHASLVFFLFGVGAAAYAVFSKLPA